MMKEKLREASSAVMMLAIRCAVRRECKADLLGPWVRVSEAVIEPTTNDAKESLLKGGWSYRKAAPALGVHWSHLAKVLTGRRESQALLKRIRSLPPMERRNHE